VPVRDLLRRAGAGDGAEVTVRSLQEGGLYGRSELNRLQAQDRDTLIALDLDGAPLHLDHGFPARLIGPNRPGVAQTKWVAELVVR
jgi:DMSO/TMAO reductase YedYZ molybdopterin-dependent catalytic subunit